MGGLCHSIIVCAHLENDTGRRCATIVAPLLLISGLARYEAVIHNIVLIFLCVYAKGCMGGDGLD